MYILKFRSAVTRRVKHAIKYDNFVTSYNTYCLSLSATYTHTHARARARTHARTHIQ
jgi:hypothetical protein